MREVESSCIYGNHPTDDLDLCIVVPTYKRVELLRKCIKSINKQTNKYDLRYKVLIISNDESFDISKIDDLISEDRFTVYLNQKNIGMCGNMNRCMKLSRGKYIAFIQDDDFLLDNYLEEIGRLIKYHLLEEYACVIPNRYYLMDENSNNGKFGKKSIRNMNIKCFISKILCLFKKNELFMEIKPLDNIKSLYSFYSGGPTCGIIFNSKYMNMEKCFDERYPYIFDYLFFMNLSECKKVVLYDKFLAVYRTLESATNNSKVQFDFFRGKYDYLLKKRNEEYISKYFDYIVYAYYKHYPEDVKSMIDKAYDIRQINKVKYLLFSIKTNLLLYSSGGYRRKNCPIAIRMWYENL